MTPVRALLASVFAAVLLGAGCFIVASFAQARPHDLLPLLLASRAPFSLVCFLAAWGAVGFGTLGVAAAFLAFIAPEEDDDPSFRRRGFPKAAPLVLIALALILLFFALRCVADAGPPIAVPVEPAPIVEEPAPPPADEPSAPPPDIRPVAMASTFEWPYMDPLMRGDGAIWSNSPQPFSDENEARRLLCGNAWVAVTGSSSEEGPAERNRARAHVRTQQAIARARSWLSRNSECGTTIVLGVDLGQHAAIQGAGDGSASAYQRRILTVSRLRRESEESIDAAEARAELEAFLANPESRETLYAGRVFTAPPQIISN